MSVWSEAGDDINVHDANNSGGGGQSKWVGGQRRQCVCPEYDDDDGDGGHREWEDSQMDS